MIGTMRNIVEPILGPHPGWVEDDSAHQSLTRSPPPSRPSPHSPQGVLTSGLHLLGALVAGNHVRQPQGAELLQAIGPGAPPTPLPHDTGAEEGQFLSNGRVNTLAQRHTKIDAANSAKNRPAFFPRVRSVSTIPLALQLVVFGPRPRCTSPRGPLCCSSPAPPTAPAASPPPAVCSHRPRAVGRTRMHAHRSSLFGTTCWRK